MQHIIKNGALVEDRWQLLAQDSTLEQLDNSGQLIVPLALWREHSHALLARDGALGIWLDAGEAVEDIADDLQHFQLVALNFPTFT
ncbi:TPA: hypothetical protein ACQJWO_005795, partial [Klebsiella pneumoniae]